MRVLSILYETGADGPGLRNSIYVAGCSHTCPGCHNPGSWNFDAGADIADDVLYNKVCSRNITITGGDPMYQPEALCSFLKYVKSRNKNCNIWVYTGFVIEELNESQAACLPYIDVLVDGPYVQSLNERTTHIHTKWAGSSNQRIIKNPAKFYASLN